MGWQWGECIRLPCLCSMRQDERNVKLDIGKLDIRSAQA